MLVAEVGVAEGAAVASVAGRGVGDGAGVGSAAVSVNIKKTKARLMKSLRMG
jgi:hypothetical protein